MKTIRIFNRELDVKISNFGSELKSIKYKGTEKLKDCNSSLWNGQAPILFPICGGLKNDCYIYKDSKYSIPKHGFAKSSLFEVEKHTGETAVFLLKSTDKTKEIYPFDFELRVIFAVLDNTLKAEFDITNTGCGNMYFSIGSHEGYSCPGGIENYSVEFEKDEAINAAVVNGNLLDFKTVPIPKSGKAVALKNEYFANDAIVLTDICSRSVILSHNELNEKIKVDFPDSPYLLLWTIPGADFLCIEPWNGLPDYVDSDCRIENKRGIIILEPGKSKRIGHKITFMP